MNERYYTACYRIKRQKAVISRAYCGLNLTAGEFRKSVTDTVFIRPKGVLS